MVGLRSGEIVLQDRFQTYIENGLGGSMGTQKVLLWNRTHAFLREDKHSNKRRSMVILNDLDTTTDKAYGQTRNNISVNIKGLITSLHQVNKDIFEAWLYKYPTVSLTTQQLAEMCAVHLADLYEEQHFGEKTGLWRMMLAFGEKTAWETAGKHFNLSNDPRFIRAHSIQGAPENADDLHYVACFTAKNNNNSFLDIVPQWLTEKTQDLAAACETYAHTLLQQPKNNHFWIRECPLGNTTQEYPDFLLFINGLPILYVEMKTPDAGLQEAVKDFQNKPNYQGAPLCLASNGKDIILTQNPQGRLETWSHYKGNMSSKQYGNNPLTVEQYFVEQIASQPHRLEFLITKCCSIGENGILKVARSQQYQALARFEQDLQWTEVANSVLNKHNKKMIAFDNRLVRHTQRTGKTHTMIRAIHLALGSHPSLFRLSLVMVGEVQILGQIHNEMKRNISLSDTSLHIEQATSRSQLNEILHREKSNQTQTNGKILLANMQKISNTKTAPITITDSEKTLIVLDEGHLTQTGSTSDMRDMIFPDATHLLFTATPKTQMTDYYQIKASWQILDDFGFEQARLADMVCPVIYQKCNYAFQDDAEKIGQLINALKPLVGDMTEEDIESVLQQEFDGSNGQKVKPSKTSREITQAIRKQLENDIIAERLKIITDTLQVYEDGLEKTTTGEPIFKPRALVFDSSTENAVRIIQYIQQYNKNLGNTDLNMLNGRRWATDVSHYGKDPTNEQERTFQELNPGISNQKDLEMRMESLDPALRVDVLLAVGKYTKGYDNDQLAVVALLRNVGEPSLMNQIYTRPATKRHGKAKGVCLDLSFGLDNQICWQQSLQLYNNTVDLNNLLDQQKVDNLVQSVKQQLEQTAIGLGIDFGTLSQPEEIIRVLYTLDEAAKKEKARAFILSARDIVASIKTLPDSSTFKELRGPIVGVRWVLSNLQSMYPELIDDVSINPDGSLDAGYSAQKLGEIIRQALHVLGQSSLKALLDVSIEAGNTFDSVSKEAQQTVEHLKIKNTRQKTIQALEEVVGQKTTKKTTSVLWTAFNKLLDKLRDGNNSIEQQKHLLKEAGKTLKEWTAHGNSMQQTLHETLEQLIIAKAASLNVSLSDIGLEYDGVLNDVLLTASKDMAEDFQQFVTRLGSSWDDQSPTILTQTWKVNYNKKLSDFLVPASKNNTQNISSDEWIQRYISLKNSNNVLNEQTSVLNDNGSFIAEVMNVALEKMQVIRDSLAWCDSLEGKP